MLTFSPGCCPILPRFQSLTEASPGPGGCSPVPTWPSGSIRHIPPARAIINILVLDLRGQEVREDRNSTLSNDITAGYNESVKTHVDLCLIKSSISMCEGKQYHSQGSNRTRVIFLIITQLPVGAALLVCVWDRVMDLKIGSFIWGGC